MSTYMQRHAHTCIHLDTHRVIFVLDMYRFCFLPLIDHGNSLSCSFGEYVYSNDESKGIGRIEDIA